MTSWFNKLLKTGSSDAADLKANDGGAGSQAPSAAGGSEPEGGSDQVGEASLQRRPLLHRNGQLAGFEVAAVTATAEPTEGASQAAVLLRGMSSSAVNGRVALITLT